MQQSSVVLTLFEKRDLFTDESLVAKRRIIAAPLIAVRVSSVVIPIGNLPENVTIHYPVVQVSHVW